MSTGISMSSVNKIKELADNGDYSLALDILEHQDLSKSLSPQFIRICGEVYYENKRYPEARAALVKAHAMAPAGNKIIYSLVKLYLSMGFTQLAERYFEIYTFNQANKDAGTYRLEYMIAKAHRKPVNELYSILVSANDVETDEEWDFEMILLHAYIRNREKFDSACVEFRAHYKNSSHLYMLDKLMGGDVDLESMMFVIFTCMMLLSWIGAHFIVSGSMTTGNLTSLFSYVMSMMMSLMMLSMVFVMISMSMASMRRISEVLEETPTMTNPDEPIMEVPDGRIDFNHVDFVYKAGSVEDTLKDIDIHIKSGETVGVIGGTGCGKSTFVNLISRLYDVKPDGGSVCVGGHDVRDYDMEVIRNEVAVVLQKNVLFSGTILDNLRWGKADATENECREVCELACADEFIDRMPDGYNTWIEQGGSNVSGGQKQRLCIARALLKSPKVLILDDSTSAVDTATDAKIRQAFATKIPNTTKIIISQRISSVQDADRIIVLDNGMVSGFDTHENLLKNNTIYKEIYDVQMSGGGDFDEKMN